MNRENILKVADAIEQHSIPDLGFNMARWISDTDEHSVDLSGHDCGTVACIGGWTLRVLGESDYAGSMVATELLGLDDDTDRADALFCPFGWRDGNYTPSQAVSVLRHLAETGEVDWDRALKAGA